MASDDLCQCPKCGRMHRDLGFSKPPDAISGEGLPHTERVMRRAQRMCATCPFRLPLTKAERRELAMIEPTGMACHTEQGYWSSSDIECRGHWEARRQLDRDSAARPSPEPGEAP